MATLPEYEPEVIELFAAKLYRKASSMLAGATAFGAATGAAFGAVPLTSLGEAWPISSTFGVATMLVGALAGAAVGHVIGDARAFGYRLQAQTALCQLEHERNSAATADAVEDLVAAIGQLIVSSSPPPPHAPAPGPPPSPPPGPTVVPKPDETVLSAPALSAFGRTA